MSDSTEVSSVQQMMNSIYISLYEFQRYVCAYILNHRRSKIYDQSDVVGIGKSPIFNLYYSQVENMIASLLDLIRIVSCSLKYVGSCKDFFYSVLFQRRDKIILDFLFEKLGKHITH